MGRRGEEFQLRKERWLARGALLAISLSFLVYCWWFVPRLTNYLVLDTEFTGWAGPIGERLARGDVPYEDFILPIPPLPAQSRPIPPYPTLSRDPAQKSQNRLCCFLAT